MAFGFKKNEVAGYADTGEDATGASVNGLSYEEFLARKKRLREAAERKRAAEKNAKILKAVDPRPQAGASLETVASPPKPSLEMWPTRVQAGASLETVASPPKPSLEMWPTRVQAGASLETVASPPDPNVGMWSTRVQDEASSYTVAPNAADPIALVDKQDEDRLTMLSLRPQAGASLFTAAPKPEDRKPPLSMEPQAGVSLETVASPSDSGADIWSSRVQAGASLETAVPAENEDEIRSTNEQFIEDYHRMMQEADTLQEYEVDMVIIGINQKVLSDFDYYYSNLPSLQEIDREEAYQILINQTIELQAKWDGFVPDMTSEEKRYAAEELARANKRYNENPELHNNIPMMKAEPVQTETKQEIPISADERRLNEFVDGLSDDEVKHLLNRLGTAIHTAAPDEMDQARKDYDLVFDYWVEHSVEGSEEYVEIEEEKRNETKILADGKKANYEQQISDLEDELNYYYEALNVLKNDWKFMSDKKDAWKGDWNILKDEAELVGTDKYHEYLDQINIKIQAIKVEMNNKYKALESVYDEYNQSIYNADAARAELNVEYEFSELENMAEVDETEINPNILIQAIPGEYDPQNDYVLSSSEAYIFMSDDEKKRIAWLYSNQGDEIASWYLLYILPELTERKLAAETEQMLKEGETPTFGKEVQVWAENGFENKFLSMTSIWNRGIMSNNNKKDTGFLMPLNTGNFAGVEIGVNRQEMNNVTQYLSEKGSLFGLADNLYQFSSDAALSLVLAPFGSAGLSFIGSTLSALDSADAAYENGLGRGLSEKEAVRYGYVVGGTKVLLSAIPVGKLLNVDSMEGFKKLIMNAGINIGKKEWKN